MWSPQSNLRLYGETTRAADALDVGLPMALGADWLPSGSMSLLAEMKVARQELVEQEHPVSAEELVTMVTSGRRATSPASAAKLGSLEVGRVADLVVLARQDDDVHESVCDSTPADVELVMVGGDVAYGRADWVHPARRRRRRPQPRAGGRLGPTDAARHQLRGQPGPATRPRGWRRSALVADLGVPAGGPHLGLMVLRGHRDFQKSDISVRSPPTLVTPTEGRPMLRCHHEASAARCCSRP